MKTIYSVRIHHNNDIPHATRHHSKNYTARELENYFYANDFQQWMDDEFLFEDETSAREKFSEECKNAISKYSGLSDTVTFDFIELLSAKSESMEDYKDGTSCDEEAIEDTFCNPCEVE